MDNVRHKHQVWKENQPLINNSTAHQDTLNSHRHTIVQQ